MDYLEKPAYRIRGFEYTDNGYCLVKVEEDVFRALQEFRLSDHCYRPRFMSRFRYPDLNTLWHLSHHQKTVSLVKQMACFVLSKYYAVKARLQHWETEFEMHLARGRDDFERW